MKFLLSMDYSVDPETMENSRVSLSLILRELGIILRDSDDFLNSAIFLLVSHCYWLPVTGLQIQSLTNEI
ncbi:MAG: hypothetical protein ACTSPI_09445 [Candidatus Heimdallarchaeaceae archaeon]